MTLPNSNEVKVIQNLYLFINQNEIEAAIHLLDFNIHRVEFETSKYQGRQAMKDHIISGRNTWAEGACNPLEFFNSDYKYVVKVHVKVRLINKSEWIDAITYDGFTIKQGLITEFHSFTSREKAFQWAGISKEEKV